MRHGIIYTLSILLLTGCATSTSQQATGTMVGMQLGSVVGGAFGSSTSHGPGGHLWGTAIGALTGAALGNVLNAPKENTGSSSTYEEYSDSGKKNVSKKNSKREARRARIEQAVAANTSSSALKIDNVEFITESGDKALSAYEFAKIAFDIVNDGATMIARVQPLVECSDTAVCFSEMTPVENLAAGEGVRYSVSVRADAALRRGSTEILIYMATDNRDYHLMYKTRIITE